MYSFGFPSSYHYFGGPSTTLLPLVMSKPKSKSRSKQLSKQLSKKLSMNPLLLLLQQHKKKSPSKSVRKSSSSSLSLKKKRKSSSSLKKKRTPSCTGIHDPYTGKSMKLSMKGPVYEKTLYHLC